VPEEANEEWLGQPIREAVAKTVQRKFVVVFEPVSQNHVGVKRRESAPLPTLAGATIPIGCRLGITHFTVAVRCDSANNVAHDAEHLVSKFQRN
jgi:hypothetical protein